MCWTSVCQRFQQYPTVGWHGCFHPGNACVAHAPWATTSGSSHSSVLHCPSLLLQHCHRRVGGRWDILRRETQGRTCEYRENFLKTFKFTALWNGGEADRIPWVNASSIGCKQLFIFSEVSALVFHFLVRIEQQKLIKLKKSDYQAIWQVLPVTFSQSQILLRVTSCYYLQPLFLSIKLIKTSVVKLIISVGLHLVFMIFTFVFGDNSKSKANCSTGVPKHQSYLFLPSEFASHLS